MLCHEFTASLQQDRNRARKNNTLYVLVTDNGNIEKLF